MIAVIAGPMSGFVVGREIGGLGAGLLCALLALPVVIILVETPSWIANRLELRRLKLTSSDELRAALEHDFQHFGHLKILRELRRRGESIDFDLPKLLRFLASHSPVDRAVGCFGIREFFPVVGERLAGYDPFALDAPNSHIVAQLLHEICPTS